MKKIRKTILIFFFCGTCVSCHIDHNIYIFSSSLKHSNDFEEQEPRECIASVEMFDTLTNWQNKIFDPSLELKGFVQYSAQISHGEGEYGLLTYLNTKDSSFVMIFAKSSGGMTCKVKGVKRIVVPDRAILFETLCRTQCNFDQPATSMIKVDSEGNVKTIRSWVIDKERGVVYKLKTSKVDCFEAYYTDYD